ncbi:MAG: PEGA domain-containing protein [Planctomycetaceae bacterium]|nr:PEGA domain-containing protein [Planctomycetaceae bacterium]
MIFVLSLFISSGGCVRRRMTVRSNPPGATVYLDGKEIGRTPFSTNFDFYGKREFRLVKDGYATKSVIKPVSAPWYELPGIDFISEVLLPGKLTDHKYYEFELEPSHLVPNHEVLSRAEELRYRAHSEGTIQFNENINQKNNKITYQNNQTTQQKNYPTLPTPTLQNMNPTN